MSTITLAGAVAAAASWLCAPVAGSRGSGPSPGRCPRSRWSACCSSTRRASATASSPWATAATSSTPTTTAGPGGARSRRAAPLLTAVEFARREERLGGRARLGDPRHDRRRRDLDAAVLRARRAAPAARRALPRQGPRLRRRRLRRVLRDRRRRQDLEPAQGDRGRQAPQRHRCELARRPAPRSWARRARSSLSADAGKTWTPVASPYKGSLFGGVVADDGAVVAFGLRGRIFRSTDARQDLEAVDNASVATADGRHEAARRRARDRRRGRHGARLARQRPVVRAARHRQHQGLSPRPILGAPNAVLLLGETGARDVPLPAAQR